MARILRCGSLFGIALTILVGCGKSTETAQTSTTGSAPQQAAQASPTDIVSQFLDEVRRGGESSNAAVLLTKMAQSELQRIGRSVQPIGSPDARFDVTRSEDIPGETNAKLVHSVWSEPNSDGSNSEYQVVWAVEREPAGWRISGLAMELEPNQPPMIIDFENGNEMDRLLSGSEPANQQPVEQQAAAPTQPLAR